MGPLGGGGVQAQSRLDPGLIDQDDRVGFDRAQSPGARRADLDGRQDQDRGEPDHDPEPGAHGVVGNVVPERGQQAVALVARGRDALTAGLAPSTPSTAHHETPRYTQAAARETVQKEASKSSPTGGGEERQRLARQESGRRGLLHPGRAADAVPSDGAQRRGASDGQEELQDVGHHDAPQTGGDGIEGGQEAGEGQGPDLVDREQGARDLGRRQEHPGQGQRVHHQGMQGSEGSPQDAGLPAAVAQLDQLGLRHDAGTAPPTREQEDLVRRDRVAPPSPVLPQAVVAYPSGDQERGVAGEARRHHRGSRDPPGQAAPRQEVLLEVLSRATCVANADPQPGVNETVMLQVMTCARKRFINIIKNKLKQIHKDISLTELPLKKIKQLLMVCSHNLQALTVLKTGDCLHLLGFKKNFKNLKACYEEETGALHPEITNINTLLKIFPALLIPLELREDANEVHNALNADKPYAITRMLQSIAQLCDYSNVEDYIKGFILSMTQTMEDIKAGLQLVEKVFGYKQIRVVPLFETEQALKQAVYVVENLFKEKSIFDHIKTTWNNRFEVMLGYSDSAKGMGVLASRLAIANTMHALDKLCRHYEIMPIFFHGSGGSIDRGGGSIREQTAWWPQSSFYIYKTTLQGEMVERNFASQPIMSNMIRKLVLEAGKEHSQLLEKSTVIQDFADLVSGYYQQQVQDPDFLEVVAKATSYRLLDKLKFGSRPVQRSKSLSIHSLRAIPWVLCWTQTRILFPTWWGVGSAWQHCQTEERKELQEAFVNNPLFRSFIKSLGFTLAKVDLSIWQIYLLTSNLKPEIQHKMITLFTNEFKMAHEAVLSISKQTNLLWFRPWLQESIKLRSPLIHPLNLLQIHAIKENDAFLIRETTTGIAAGMLTTG